MNINTIKQAELRLQKYVPNVSKFTGDNMSLERMWPLLALFDNPHEKLKTIHVAGTSGKTSTCYYIASLLTESGNKAGLTVSPHVYSLTERVQINNEPLQESVFCRYLETFLTKLELSDCNPSYFELLIVFSLWVFASENVEYVVLETGMGGLLDGSNVVTRRDKVCVITDIGFDHMHILGNTLAEISAQKAGIIHENNEVFLYEQTDEIMTSIRVRAVEKKAKIHIVDETLEKKLDAVPAFQKRNYRLAQQVCNFVAKRDKFKLHEVDPSSVSIPGRMETHMLRNGTTLILDGAHNEQKVMTFIESFRKLYPDEHVTALVAFKKGKDFQKVLPALSEIVEEVILTSFSASQDLPVISENPHEISLFCTQNGINNKVYRDNKKASKALLASDSSIKLVIGSFYLLGQVKHYLTD